MICNSHSVLVADRARRSLAWCILTGILVVAAHRAALAADSIWVKVGQSGRLQYLYDSRGDRIMDYSMVGYKTGIVPLPNYSDVVLPADIITVAPVSTGNQTSDAAANRANIQAAINLVAGKTAGSSGYKGVVQLQAGTYLIDGTLNINSSGIILRGVGDDASGANSTVLKSTVTAAWNQNVGMIQVDSGASRSTTNTHNIADKVVPVGATSLTVDSTAGYAVGDNVLITRPAPQNWIQAIGMDASGPMGESYWASNQGDPVGPPPTAPSTQFNQNYERKITYIDQTNHRIFFDAALPNSLEKQYGTSAGFAGTISKFTFARTSNVGIENIRADGMAAFVPGVTPTNGQDGPENHASSFIFLQDTTDSWVRNITGQHLSYTTVEVSGNSRNITVDDANTIEPVGEVTGGRFYPYNIEGQFTLMTNLKADNARHEFINNAPSRGPNVFLDGVATNGHADSGNHQRWSTGTLFDNITTTSDLDSENRLTSGSGHGWAGANMVMWNSKASDFYVQSPPTAQNWLIGSQGTIHDTAHAGIGPLPAYKDDSGTTFSSKVTLNGETSLYRAQLAQRTAHLQEEQREYWVGDFDNFVADPGEVTPVDSTWLSAVQAANPSKTVQGFDASLSPSNAVVPFTFSFDAPNKPVRSATLTMAIHSGGGSAAADDRIYLDSLSNSIGFSELGAVQHFENSDIVQLEFLPSDIRKALSFLSDGKLNVLVSDTRTVDWADLVFTLGGQTINWTGSASNTWDINMTQNWNDGSAGTNYFEGDVVTFGDGPTNRTIFVDGSVAPGAITVNNSSGNNYNFFGGAITGSTGILKQGAGTLTLQGSNTFTGAVLIQGGTIVVTSLANGGAASNLGASSNAAGNLAFDGGTLRWTGNANTFTDRLFTLGAGGGTIDVSPTTSAGLFFTNVGVMALAGSGPRTLTLTGTELDLSDLKGNLISAVINDAAADQKTSIVKAGNNYWILDGANGYSGGTTISGGRLRPSQPTSFGTGAVSVANGAQAYLSLTGTIANAFSIAGNGISETSGGNTLNLGALRLQNSPVVSGQITLTANARITAQASDGTLAGKITGGFALELGGGGSTGSLLTLSSTANDWSGGLTISRGQVNLGASNVIPNGSGKGNLTINALSGTGNTSILEMNGFSETINGLASSGTGTNAQINNSTTTAVTLTVGDNDQTSTFGGVIKNTGTGALGLTKIGAGTLTLTGANTYKGPTNVNAGTLLVNGSHTGGGLYSVASGATLGGTGSFSAGIDLDGILSPGASIESLAVSGPISFGNTSVLQIELNGSTGAVDLLQVGGAITIDPGALIQFLITGAPTANQYVFGQYFSTLSGSFASSTVPQGYQLVQGAGQFKLVAVPEPSALALAAIGLVGLVIWNGRRRQGGRVS